MKFTLKGHAYGAVGQGENLGVRSIAKDKKPNAGLIGLYIGASVNVMLIVYNIPSRVGDCTQDQFLDDLSCS